MTGHIDKPLRDLMRRAALEAGDRAEEHERRKRAEQERKWADAVAQSEKALPLDSYEFAQEVQRGQLARSAAFRALMELPPGPAGVLLCGPSGTGKTVALCGAAGRALWRRPPPTLAYISCARLANGADIPDEAWWADLCLLDDFHLAATWLPYRRAGLHGLLDKRKEFRKLTITASEWSRKKLVARLGRAIVDRVGLRARTFEVFAEGIDWREG